MKIHSKCKFSQQEDQLLFHLVQIDGENNWKIIANQFPDRSARQIRERWRFYLNPNLDMNPFTLEEDKIVIEAQKQFGNSWKTISQLLLPNRTDIAIRNRFRQLNKEPTEDKYIQVDFFHFQFDGAHEDFIHGQYELFPFL
jgi:myb proto-oncogene protein